MKLIKFLLKSVVFMFILLFLVFFIYIYNDNKTTVKEAKYVQISEERIKIEPIIASDKIEETQILTVEPATTKSNTNSLTSNKKFYYNNLSEYSKLIYDALENQKQNLKKGNTVINLPSEIGKAVDNDNSSIEAIFSVAINAFEYDNPDIFYIDASKMVLYYEKDFFGRYKIYIKNDETNSNYLVNGFNGESDIQVAQENIDSIVDSIKNETDKLSSEYEKILYVHNWLTNNIKYDETLNRTNKDTIYGAFVENEVVCGGYAKAFKYIMDILNIDTIIVQGIGTNEHGEENHAWNYIKLNEKWYGIDCTWDDPIIIGDLMYYQEQNFYTYFLKGEEVFAKDHKPFNTFYGTDLKINYPELSKENYE